MYQEILTYITTKLGVSQEQANEFFNLLSEEIFSSLFEVVAETSSDEDLKTWESRMENAKSPEHYSLILEEIGAQVYEGDVKEELKKSYMELIDESVQMADQAKDLINRANQGDENAKKLLDTVQQTDTYKNITSTPDSF